MLTILSTLVLAAAAPQAAQAVDPVGSIQRLQIPSNPGQGPIAIAVELEGRPVILELKRNTVRSADFKLYVARPDGSLAEMPAPAPNTWRGTALDETGAPLDGVSVQATINREGLTALVEDDAKDQLWQIQPAAGFGPDDYSVALSTDLVLPAGTCGVQNVPSAAHVVPQGFDRGTGLQLCEIALDSDWEFFLDNGSSVNATVDDMERIINRVDFIYERDTDVTFQITAIIVRSTSSDPYTTNNASPLLDQVDSQWSNNLGFIQRDIVHMFTGRNLNGSTLGIAFLNAICNTFNGYGLSERYTTNLVGRTAVCAHELGHNFSAQHCDGNGNCRIMCSGVGGCNNDLDDFGTPVANQIASYAVSRNCLLNLPQPVAIPFIDTVGTQINTAFWISSQGVQSSTAAVNEPSGTRSYRFNAANSSANADDVLISNRLLLAGLSSAEVVFEAQARGVQSGGVLRVDLFDSLGNWVEIGRVTSNGTTQTSFGRFVYTLPASAFHDAAQIRFVAEVNGTNENWYVDDIEVTDSSCGTMASFCLGTANTTGAVGNLAALGSASIATNDLIFFGSNLPQQQFGLLIYGDAPSFSALADGFLCVGGTTIYRYQIAQIDSFGSFGIFFDQTTPGFAGTTVAGETAYFQFWHRDLTSGGANLTTGFSVKFCP